MLNRRSLLKGLLTAPWWLRAQEIHAQASRGSAPLKIKDIKVIATSPRSSLRWVFIKVLTSEDGLYGLGSQLRVSLLGGQGRFGKHMVPSGSARRWIASRPVAMEPCAFVLAKRPGDERRSSRA